MTRDTIHERDFLSLYRLRSAIREFLHFSDEAARAAGIEPQQHQLLLAIKASPAGHLRIGDAAAALYIRPHSAVELVDRTLHQGLVRRQRSEHDRREVNVSLTPEGEAVLRHLSLHHRDELQRMGPGLEAALHGILGDKAHAIGSARS